MGVNWLPGRNPETMPRLCYIPKICLPTVFGDALSYMEMVNQINYHFNEAIDNINKLAENITEVVQESIEGAKIPVYANLVHNGSHIISPNNWNIDKPENIWDGMAAGKMCILFGQLAFNVDGVPVVQENNNMYFILTEFYQTSMDSNNSTARATFMSYDYQNVRYLDMQFVKTGGNVTSEVIAFTQYALPTTEDFNAIYSMFKRDVSVYKGAVRIASREGEYIELTDNATTADLSEYFVVQTGGTFLAPNCAPCIVVDYYNGRVGELKYGGDATPWARIYSTGVRMGDELYEYIRDVNQSIDDINVDINGISGNIATLEGEIDNLGDAIDDVSDTVDALDAETVKCVEQNLTSGQKEIARNNIDAPSTQNPVFTGELVLDSGYGASVNFTVTKVDGRTVLYFDPVRVQINGLLDPTSAQMAATKNYVDNAVDAVDAVKYSVQQPTDAEKEIARENIGAVGAYNPHFFEALYVEGTNRTLALSVSSQDSGTVVLLGGTYGDKIVRNVADPIANNDAANKLYVDNKFGTMNNAVLFTPQTLAPSQMAQARSNIGARSFDDNDFYGPLDLYTRDDETYHNRLAQLNWESDDSTVTKIAFMLMSNAGITFINEDDSDVDLYLGSDLNDKVVTLGVLNDSIEPLKLQINSAENAWTILNPPTPAYTQLPNIISAYAGGKRVMVSYPTTGVAGVGYAEPKCVSTDFGIAVEAYNGTAWKRYFINADGTVTTTTI